MTRFVLRERPQAYPRYDIITRDSNPGPVFDLGVLLEAYDGSIYLRPADVIEMARQLGMATTDEVAELRATIGMLDNKINQLPHAQEELRSGLDSLISEFHSNLRGDKPPVPVPSVEPEQVDRKPETPKRKAVGSINI